MVNDIQVPKQVTVAGKKYKVTKELGRGAFGCAVGAIPMGTKSSNAEDRVCIKIMTLDKNDEYFKHRLRDIKREIVMLDHLQKYKHPNLLRLIDYGMDPSGSKYNYYIVTEWIDGKTLREYMVSGDFWRWPIKHVVHVMAQIASGIAMLHHLGIVHRDIKADNTMLVVNGRKKKPVIIDFGFASMYYPEHAEKATKNAFDRWKGKFPKDWVVSDNHWKGTPTYIAPELWERNVPEEGTNILRFSDVFATGCMFYHMINRERPWKCLPRSREDRDRLRDEIINRSWQESSSNCVSAKSKRRDLNFIIDRMLAKDPRKRPSMYQVYNALRQILKSL